MGEATSPDLAAHAQMLEHLHRYVGTGETVFQELISLDIHLDILIFPPAPHRPYATLVTSGMSDRPMTVPEKARGFEYAELMLCLPAKWPLDERSWRNENHYWPVRWLKILARLPHTLQTWLFVSQVVPNHDPPRPFAPNTDLCAMLIDWPTAFNPAIRQLTISPEKTVRFYNLVPLYQTELAFKQAQDYDALSLRLLGRNVTEIIDPHRPDVTRDRWRPWRQWRRRQDAAARHENDHAL